MAKRLTRDEILAGTALKTMVVPVPEWGADTEVIVRELSAAERDAYESATMPTEIDAEGNARTTTNFKNVKARLVVMGVIDESGARVFTDDDVEKLGAKSSVALDRLWRTIRTLSGMTKEARKAIEKNSEAG